MCDAAIDKLSYSNKNDHYNIMMTMKMTVAVIRSLTPQRQQYETKLFFFNKRNRTP